MSRRYCPLARTVVWLGFVTTLGVLTMSPALSQTTQFPGGFLERDDAAPRSRWTNSQVQSIIPAERTKFTYPAPYNTEAFRLTIPNDCGNRDCVHYVGYSYWRNINNHVNSHQMLIFVTLKNWLGGQGPTLFSFDKTTEQITKVGPLFSNGSPFASQTGEGWYFSGTKPTVLYLMDGPKLVRYDVVAKTFQPVFDVSTQFGQNRKIWQPHSSDDDLVHSATLQDTSTGAYLGCVVYLESTHQFRWYPRLGTFDECQVDKSGRWTVSLEDIGVSNDLANRIFDNVTGQETVLSGPYSTLGHMDMGFGYMVGADNYNALPNATILWNLEPSINLGPVVHYNPNWTINHANQPTHTNARRGVAAADQFACGSCADRSSTQNEIVCFRLNGSNTRLVVAPVMTDLNASGGGDDYGKTPKGNLDVTGKYFLWTSNVGSNRLDAFLVKVPNEVLYGAQPLAPAKPAKPSPPRGKPR